MESARHRSDGLNRVQVALAVRCVPADPVAALANRRVDRIRAFQLIELVGRSDQRGSHGTRIGGRDRLSFADPVDTDPAGERAVCLLPAVDANPGILGIVARPFQPAN